MGEARTVGGAAADRRLALLMVWACVPLPLIAVIGPQALWSAGGWDLDVIRYFLTPLVAILFWLVANGAVELTGVPIPVRVQRAWVLLLVTVGLFLGTVTLLSVGPVATVDPGIGDGFAFVGLILLGLQWLAALVLTAEAFRHAWWIGHWTPHGRGWRLTAS